MPTHPFDLDGRIALVTGAGRGIGRAIAETLARAGADIAVAEIQTENGLETARRIESLGRRAVFVPCDVSDRPSVDAAVQQVAGDFGRIDILVNNAGIAKHQPAEDTPDEDWLRMMAVNVHGTFWCARAVGRVMLAQGRGAIVNLGSMSGLVVNNPQPQAAYNVSKAAVIMLTKSLAAEWTGRGVRVNCVSPGYIDTEMCAVGVAPEWKTFWKQMTPMGRMGEAHEIAQAVLYLASDASSFATGTNLVVDGGYTCW